MNIVTIGPIQERTGDAMLISDGNQIHFIDFWGGRGSFQSMPEAVRAYCRTTTAANLLDWHGAMAADLTAHDCVQLDCDVLLVRGSEANALIVAITDLLREHLPNAQPRVVAGAGHFLISSHADECGALLAGFLPSF